MTAETERLNRRIEVMELRHSKQANEIQDLQTELRLLRIYVVQNKWVEEKHEKVEPDTE